MNTALQASVASAWRLVLCQAVFLGLLALAAPALAVTPTIDIYGPSQGQMNIALAQPLGGTGASPAPPEGQTLQNLISQNLSILPFLKVLPGSHIPGGDRLAGYKAEEIDFKRFQLAGCDLLLTAGWPEGNRTVELRVYQAFTNNLILGKAYSDLAADRLPSVADKFCQELMEALTGHGEFFRSTLAFARPTGKNKADIFTIKPTGRELRQVTSLNGICMSPTWSPDGRYIAFTYLTDRNHLLGLADLSSGKISTTKFPGNAVVSPRFRPDGRIVVSLNFAGNHDIVLLGSNLKMESKLVASNAIDVQPTFDRSGGKMAYVSDRLGGPQVFIGDSRVSQSGSYNTDPSLSPDGDLLAYCRRTGEGFRIVVQDLARGVENQISTGPGNDEQPAFAPDGFFVAFTSSRAGGERLWLTTRHGAPAVQLPINGQGSYAAWHLGK